MNILPPSAALKADMKKVGDVMLKEWLDKAGPEGQHWSTPSASKPGRCASFLTRSTSAPPPWRRFSWWACW
jgi:hypothetical protein